ncbi:MAG: hypothetical protein IKK29_02785 [Christensenellaceae bacterium]|nr:hypothetical protein [Christensenellaceae bacterium]
MRKKPIRPDHPLFDDFFNPVDAIPYLPDPIHDPTENDVLDINRQIEDQFESILLLLLREYRRILSEGGIRRRTEIVRRSAVCGCFADAPLDRKTCRELAQLEQDLENVLSPEQMTLFETYRRILFAQYEWSIEYTQKFCAGLTRKKLREWIIIVYDE